VAETLTQDLVIARRGAVLEVTFNRPEARNALTWAMYDGLEDVCDQVQQDEAIRAVLLRGAGDKAFVAGTDISQFDGFDGPAGIAYEARIGAVLNRILGLSVPVLASIRGFCVGGGLAIAACADIRVAAPDARFGVPIARTLGNTLSAASIALLEAQLGRSRVSAMLVAARMVDAQEALTAGFVTDIADDPDLAARQLADRVAAHAPLTIWATKELLRRTHARAGAVPDDDVVGRVYGSSDFASAVVAFGRREAPRWSGA